MEHGLNEIPFADVDISATSTGDGKRLIETFGATKFVLDFLFEDFVGIYFHRQIGCERIEFENAWIDVYEKDEEGKYKIVFLFRDKNKKDIVKFILFLKI